jgi:hypothetical protein
MAALFGRRRRKPLTWSVVVSSPKGAAGAQWGDTWFAADLVDALTRAGEKARTVFRSGATAEARENDDVVLVLRGLRRVVPRRGTATWLLWVISHPELVEPDEPAQFDAAFAASEHWDRSLTGEFGVPVHPLLQATNPRRFRPSAAVEETGADVLFVGSTRGEFRPVVRDALAAGIELSVYGVGWEAFLPPEQIQGEFISNADLPAAYAAAGVVLNDHWRDMAEQGFLSNRLFDATATGARVLSDEAAGLHDVFGQTVRTYTDPQSLSALLSGPPDDEFASRAERLDLADRVARDHSFDARAAVLIERVDHVRGSR